jgi:hypothetical protein
MPLNNFRTALSVSFSVNEDILLMPNQARSSFGGKGVLIGAQSSLDPSVSHNYTWYEHVSWFAICYWYGREAEGALGSPWIANSQYVYLGGHAPLSAEQRTELVEKINARILPP